jgi:GTP-binding protein LepA
MPASTYHIEKYEEGDLVKMSILVNDDPVDALSMIVNRQRAEGRGRAMCEKAERPDPAPHVQDPDPGRDRRQGDRARNPQRPAQGRHRQMLWRRHSRKRKLLDKQKEGKKKMRQFGKVEIPQEAFIAALKMED